MIEKNPFGKTNHQSTRTLFGAAALGRCSQAAADRVLDLLFEYGINHIDTAASYGDAELPRGPWGDKPKTHNTWYEPFTTQADIDLAVHWVLSRPGVLLNTVADITLLPMVLNAASRFDPATKQSDIAAKFASVEMEPLFV